MKGLFKYLLGISSLLCLSLAAWAAGETLGSVADNITSNFTQLSKFLSASCYVAGTAMMGIGLFQLKQHKENPTQVAVSKGITTMAISTALLFIPSITQMASYTVFGQSGGSSSGPSGALLVSSSSSS